MQLKHADSPEEKEQIIEMIWGLKVDRHAITRKLETMSRASWTSISSRLIIH
ncbi:hypothetical protein Q0F98_39645 [Paenibacillus amylolyticus]|nr:hypothetical protein Q0F98_39645 [Paenibacillus amylolyticus]